MIHAYGVSRHAYGVSWGMSLFRISCKYFKNRILQLHDNKSLCKSVIVVSYVRGYSHIVYLSIWVSLQIAHNRYLNLC